MFCLWGTTIWWYLRSRYYLSGALYRPRIWQLVRTKIGHLLSQNWALFCSRDLSPRHRGRSHLKFWQLFEAAFPTFNLLFLSRIGTLQLLWKLQQTSATRNRKKTLAAKVEKKTFSSFFSNRCFLTKKTKKNLGPKNFFCTTFVNKQINKYVGWKKTLMVYIED